MLVRNLQKLQDKAMEQHNKRGKLLQESQERINAMKKDLNIS